jgi:hypothetical protein
MSQVFGTTGEGGILTDREIAEDILTGQKYLSNYYYAPAILEAMDPELRNTFQQVHNDTQTEAKQVFDYLNARGWYKPRQADAQSVNDLKNAAQESQQILSSVSGETTKTGGKSTVIGGQNPYTQSTQSMPGNVSYSGTTWHSQPQSFQTGTPWQPSYSQAPQWTGTQAGEGQSGMGPSSLAQWTRWGGQPSWMQTTTGGFPGGASGGQVMSGTQGAGYSSGGTWQPQSYQTGTGWQSQPQSFQTGTPWQPSYSQAPQWTGTQAGEGQSGMGPSSLGQWARWGGQPSWMQTTTGGFSGGVSGGHGIPGTQGAGYSAAGTWQPQSYQTGTGWQSQPQSFQTGTLWQPSYSQAPQWTGTQAGEGQSGMGPSSLGQWARWGGQPSWMQGQTGSVQTSQSQWA